MGLNKLQRFAVEQALQGANLLLTGQAGTGKSYTLTELIRQLGRKKIPYGLAAMTGVAALNIGGSTIHSWAGIGLAEEDKDTIARAVQRNKRARERIRGAQVLIVDEISMCSRELFEKLDWVFRVVRENKRVPFGGIQLLPVGDFLQLPPVSRTSEKSFCFESGVWDEASIHTIQLKDIIRQDAGGDFAKLLSKIRTGDHNEDDLDLLDSRFGHRFPDDGINPVTLICTNKNVDAHNEKKLKELDGGAVTIEAEDDGQANYFQFFDRNCPAPKNLTLKVGAQVMLLQNLDVEGGLVNGSVGVVEGFNGKTPTVRFANGIQTPIVPHKWEAKEQVFKDDGSWRMRKAATREQLPLKLAWAMTVHKSQGSTIDRVILDAGDAFEEGMLYVALSRVRDLESLSVKSINYDRIRINKKCKAFYER